MASIESPPHRAHANWQLGVDRDHMKFTMDVFRVENRARHRDENARTTSQSDDAYILPPRGVAVQNRLR